MRFEVRNDNRNIDAMSMTPIEKLASALAISKARVKCLQEYHVETQRTTDIYINKILEEKGDEKTKEHVHKIGEIADTIKQKITDQQYIDIMNSLQTIMKQQSDE